MLLSSHESQPLPFLHSFRMRDALASRYRCGDDTPLSQLAPHIFPLLSIATLEVSLILLMELERNANTDCCPCVLVFCFTLVQYRHVYAAVIILGVALMSWCIVSDCHLDIVREF